MIVKTENTPNLGECTMIIGPQLSLSAVCEESLKYVFEDIILDLSERVYESTHWLVRATHYWDCVQFDDFSIEMSCEIESKLKSGNSSLIYFFTDNDHILLLFNTMNKEVFEFIKNAELPDGSLLGMDIVNADFEALTKARVEDIIGEAAGLLDIMVVESTLCGDRKVAGIYLPKYCRKPGEWATIRCKENKREAIKSCLIQVFNRHRIGLSFVDEWPFGEIRF